MKVLLILFSLGSIWALQQQVEYEYQYEGRLATGIPGIRAQVAAVGIKARLTLQMKEKTQGIAKLSEIQVGHYNDDLECVQLRQPVPIHYSPMPDQYNELLEKPFAVYFQEHSGQVMKVSESDVEFITNIRKSVVEMLKLEPLISNLGGIQGDQLSQHVSGGKAPDVFSLEEDSIFGRCEHQYTIKRLTHREEEEEKEFLKSHIKQDDQSEESPRSSSSSIPKMVFSYYRLVRAINFDKCHDRVIQQHSGGANMSHLGHSQFRSVQSRSSVSTYILKGVPGFFRVERGMVEGDVIANPFGFKSQRLQAITNQSLILERAQPIRTPIRLPTDLRPVKSWKYEVASPFKAPEGHVKEWINYHNKGDKYFPVSLLSSLGLPLQEPQLSQHKSKFLKLLDQVEEEIYADPKSPSPDPSRKSTKSSIATSLLHSMTKILKRLSKEKVQEIFSETFAKKSGERAQRKQTILVDVSAASGAAAPIKVLLEKMKRKELTPARIASIFTTIPNNLFAPSVIPDLLEYVKSLDIKEHPLLTSSALVNFASLAERVCLNQKAFNYSVPSAVYGSEDCKPSIIIHDFLKHLEQKAETASKSYEREVYLQAIANLGTPKIVKSLKPYIYGQHDSTLNVRLVAIYGLTKRRMPDSARDLIFETLMPVVENSEDRDDIRQAAFSALLTWEPDSALWQRMARLTWRERSQSMAAFIAFTIESLAKSTEPQLKKQATIAAFALPLMKPYSPSLKYSYNRIYSRYDPHSKVGIESIMSTIKSSHKSSPSQIYASLRENFGDLKFQLLEVALTSENLGKHLEDLVDSLQSASSRLRQSPVNFRSSAARQMESDMQNDSSHKDKETSIYLRAFKNLYQYIPVNRETVKKVFGEDGEDLLKKLHRGKKLTVTKYLNPIDIEYFLPTEIGLPLVGSAVMPTMNVGEAHVQLIDHDPKPSQTIDELIKKPHVSLRFQSSYKYMSKLIVKMSVLTPWDLKMIEAGVENYDEVNLPVQGDVTVKRTQELLSVRLDMSPHIQQKFPVLHGHNIPFTQIRKLDAQDEEKSIVSYKVIGVKKDRQPALKVQKKLDKKHSGLDAELDFHADTPYPFTLAYLEDYLRKPAILGKILISPESKQWQYSLNLDPSSSDTKNISLDLTYLTLNSSSDQSSSERIPDLSAEDHESQRLEKLRKLSEGSKVYAVSAQLLLEGSGDFRKYEAVAAITRRSQYDHQSKKHKVLVAALSKKLPGHPDGFEALCSQTDLDTPAIKTYDDLKKAIESGPRGELRSKIYYGKSCASDSIASLKGSLKLSSERQRLLEDEVKKICNFDPRDPVVELQTAAVYDKGSLEIDYVENKVPKNLRNLTLSIRDNIEGFLFPHGYHNSIHSGQQNKITIDVERKLSSKGYTFFVEMPSKHSIYTEIHVPYAVTRVVPFLGLKTTESSRASSILVTKMIDDQCTIKDGNIWSFDGSQFQFDPVNCFTKLAIDERTPDLFYARVNLNGTQNKIEAEIKVQSQYLHTEVRFDSQAAFINDEKVDYSLDQKNVVDSQNRLVIVITRQKNPPSYQVELKGNFTVEVNEQQNVLVTPQDGVRTHLRGLCGDYDGNPSNDRRGPKDCQYTDDNLFKYSWTTDEGKGCDEQEYQQMEKQVEQFQQHCTKIPSDRRISDIRSFYEKKLDHCSEHVYPIQHEGNGWCASTVSALVCVDGCTYRDQKFRKLHAKCWTTETLPKDVREAERVGYMLHAPREEAPFVGEVWYYEPTSCKR